MEHRLITGGEQYLPFARSCITKLKKLGLPYADQSYEIDGVSIKVRIEPGHEYIRIDGEPYKYQFFSTGPTQISEVAGGWRYYKGYAVAVATKPVTKSLPRGSSVEPSAPGVSPSWSLAAYDQLTNRLPIKKVLQSQGITEHQFFPQANGRLSSRSLIDSWSSGSQIENLSSNGGNRRDELLRTSVDIAYDVPPTKFGWKTPDADWYKRAAIRTVVHPEFGSRQFILLTDISNTLHIYPVSAPTDAPLDDGSQTLKNLYSSQAIKTNISSGYVQSFSLPLPNWCRTPTAQSRGLLANNTTLTDLLIEVPQYRWAFNSSATKLCAAVYEPLQDFAGYSGMTPAPTFLNDAGTGKAIHEALPGLVEFSVDITIIGAGLAGFIASVSASRELRPTVTGKYVMGADYAWAIPGATGLDDLVLMTAEIYHSSLDRSATGAYQLLQANKTLIKVENFTASTLLRTIVVHADNRDYLSTNLLHAHYPDTHFKTADAVLMAFDLRTLAFVVRQKYTELALTWTGPGTVDRDIDGLSAVRIQTYMRNSMVDEIVMATATESAIDGRLVNFFADASTTGLFKMPITERGLASYQISAGVYNAYDSLGLGAGSYDGVYQGYVGINPISGSEIDVGALFYSQQLVPVMAMNGHNQFAVHPDGSWSVATQPVSYFPGPLATGTSGVYDIGGTFDITKMRSAMVDLVWFQNTRSLTNHLSLLNSAYSASYTASQFLPSYEVRTRTSGATTEKYLVDTSSDRAFRLESKTSGSYATTLPRPHQFDFQTNSTVLWAAVNGNPPDTIVNKTPVLGGSALFI